MMIWGANRAVGTDWTLNNMTGFYKTVVFLLIILPRMIIAVLVVWIGAIYILNSSDAETMLLNTLAVLFVLDIDEFFYQTFTATHMKMQLTTVPEIKLNPGKWTHVAGFFNSLVGYPALVTIASLVIF